MVAQNLSRKADMLSEIGIRQEGEKCSVVASGKTVFYNMSFNITE